MTSFLIRKSELTRVLLYDFELAIRDYLGYIHSFVFDLTDLSDQFKQFKGKRNLIESICDIRSKSRYKNFGFKTKINDFDHKIQMKDFMKPKIDFTDMSLGCRFSKVLVMVDKQEMIELMKQPPLPINGFFIEFKDIEELKEFEKGEYQGISNRYNNHCYVKEYSAEDHKSNLCSHIYYDEDYFFKNGFYGK